jgi:hypothetical protein
MSVERWTAPGGLGGVFEPHGDCELLVPAGLATTAPLPVPVAPGDVEDPVLDHEDHENEDDVAPVTELEPAPVDRRPVRRLWRGREVAQGESAESLWERLTEARAVLDVQRENEQERLRQDVGHRIAVARIQEWERDAVRARRERERDAAEETELAELYRVAGRSGERARIRADIHRSAEMRALRVARVQRVALLAGVPILLAFGGWSTTGVQAGVVRLLGLDAGSPSWWAAWLMEPALIAVVALIIIGRAVLRSSGGETDWRADVAEWAALGTSLALNIFGGWHGSGLAAFGAAVAHSVGPAGCAGVAFLIGVFVDYTTRAQPWEGAPRLAEMDLRRPAPVLAGFEGRTAIKRGKHGLAGVESDGLPDEVRKLLGDVQAAIETGVLSPDPTGYAIYKHVMGGKGDRARSSKVAALVAGWRPGLRAV